MDYELLQDDATYPKLPDGRFNDWGQRKWLKADETWSRFVEKEVRKLNMSRPATDLCKSAMLTNSKGVEFVLFSDAQFPRAFQLHKKALVVPCFEPIDPMRGQAGDDRALAMSHRGIFIYDGWIAVENWDRAILESYVELLQEASASFSVLGGWFMHWEPKYRFSNTHKRFFQVSFNHLESFQSLVDVVDDIPPQDRTAIHRSAGWISSALKASSPLVRFLLLFVSIEALATYIERKARDDSPLRPLATKKLSKSERRIERENCINRILSSSVDENPTKAIQDAYFLCVQGTKRTVEEHLNEVFEEEAQAQLLFEESPNRKSLWNVRNDIAHGSLYLLSDKDVQEVELRLPALERMAGDYLRKVVGFLAHAEPIPQPPKPALVFPASAGVGGKGTEYAGPTDMAEYYANIDPMLSSRVHVTFN